MNTKNIICPNCNAILKIGINCHHQADLSLVCNKCEKIVFPVDESQERTVTRSFQAKGRNYVNSYDFEN